ncbi:MAG: protein phosphatase 2C domain-containing protein [Ruminococcus sp.]|nr:protein phosphatase 2C domain-containing protein [Ruminococcus sp.]
MFNGFSRSVRGASHEARDLVCQDSSAHKVTEYYAVAVVADGHGSKKHFRSNVGSRFAVESTVETIDRFYQDPEEFEKSFPERHKAVIKNIEKQIITTWNAKVTEHITANPVTPEEKSKFTDEEFAAINVESYYGTTLIAAVAGRGFCFGLMIGDGNLVAVFDDGEAVLPMEYDESAPANVTASMCNANAASMFNSFYRDKKKVLAMFTSTDGLYTSFGSDYDFLDFHTIIASNLVKAEAMEASVYKNLEKRSHFGTEDDISLSCVFDVEGVAENNELLLKKVAENKEKAAKRRKELLTTGLKTED